MYRDFPFNDPIYSGVANILALHGMGMTSDWSWNDPSWSISVELWASILVFQVLVRKFNGTALFLFSLLCYALVVSKHQSLMASFDFAWFYLSSGFLKCMGGMALGIWIHKLSCKSDRGDYKSGLTAEGIDIVLFIFLMLFTGMNISMPKIDCVMVVCFALLIYRLQVRKSALRKMLGLWPLNFLGKISFSLYLIHTPILLVLGRFNDYTTLPLIARMAIFLSVAFCSSYFLHILFEKRIYKFLKKIIDEYSDIGPKKPLSLPKVV